jgi:hypothetical protein
MFDVSLIGKYPKIVVELGSGDGRLLSKLAQEHSNRSVLLIGIESDSLEHHKACKNFRNDNILFINDSFEIVVVELQDKSIDTFISVLPHPRYVDKDFQDSWIPFYRILLKKLKDLGIFLLVTELTDELLQPVESSAFIIWKQWLHQIFRNIGFKIEAIQDGHPCNFSSHFLDQFKGDAERIKIVTLFMTKDDSQCKK